MAAADKATGFLRGFQAARNDVRQRKQEDQDRALKQSELAHAQSRRAITESRADTQWEQGQADRTRQQSELQAAEQQKQAAVLKQAEQEGVRTLADSLDAGLDPAIIEQRFNSSGDWKIAPGTLKYDPTTKNLEFTGSGGQRFRGTTQQLRAMYGQTPEPGKPIELNKGSRLVDSTGKVLVDTPAEPPSLEQVDTTKDLYEIRDGKRTLVKKGVPAAGSSSGSSSRNVSAFNPESHAKEAVDIANTAFKTKWNADTQSYVFDNPDDSERQAYAADLITSWMAQKGAESQNYGAGEIGNLGFKASKALMTSGEAETKAKKAGLVPGSDPFNREVARLIRDSDEKAEQIWNDGLKSIKAKREAKEQADGGFDKYWKK